MFSIDEFIIAVFCCVDDLLEEVTQGKPIRHGGFTPRLSDAEVLTMEIVGEYRGLATDQGIWQYFRQHWLAWFPGLSSRTSWTRQAANLGQYKALLQQHLAARLGAFSEDVHLIDGFPIPVCEFRRATFCRSFRGDAGYGYCASKGKTYYGFHGHLNITVTGVITSFCLTPAAGDEREALWETVSQIHGILIGDKGYLSSSLKTDLLRECIDLQTQLRDNMTDTRPAWWLKLLKRVRRLVETVIGQLVGRFSIEHVWARDLWHLTTRLNRKLLAHTVCRWLNRFHPNPLCFADLVSS
ncbi:MAG: IS982 family transposase [Leptolyngbyaceae cyanobacterium bins.349]|nr:IS982 family transposase [Leptolyngbyaceae cyanobacterium bins.349]